MKSKKLKITDYCVRGSYENLFYPKCNIQGKWLRDLGFEIGDTVQVTYQQGKIIITKADQEEE